MQIVKACVILGTSDKVQTPSDVEQVLNSIMSLVVMSVARDQVSFE